MERGSIPLAAKHAPPTVPHANLAMILVSSARAVLRDKSSTMSLRLVGRPVSQLNTSTQRTKSARIAARFSIATSTTTRVSIARSILASVTITIRSRWSRVTSVSMASLETTQPSSVDLLATQLPLST